MKTALAKASSHLYERLAERLASRVDDGTLRPGERVPSVRTFSQQNGVSVSTAVQAYWHLESRGYIESRPQSGFYVLPPPSPPPLPARGKVPPASAVTVDELVVRMYAGASRPDYVSLGAATAHASFMPQAALSRVLSSALRREGSTHLAYCMSPGWEPLRRQLARRGVTQGLDLSAGDVLITTGCMEALNLSLHAVSRPGDVVAMEAPTYFGVLLAAQNLGLRVVEIPTSENGLSLPALWAALKRHKVKAVVASPNVQNPMGGLMPDAAKEELVAELARQDVPLIEDDIYGDLSFSPTRPQPAKVYDTKGNVLLCSSFSKSLAPGWRVGWIAGGRFHDRLIRLKLMTTVANTTAEQIAIADYLQGGSYDRHLRRLRPLLLNQVHMFQKAVLDRFPAGTRVSRPRGGFVLWVELPEGTDGLAVFDRAAEQRITVCPGPIFSASRRYRNCLRLSCALPWTPRVDQALRTLGHIVADLAP